MQCSGVYTVERIGVGFSICQEGIDHLKYLFILYYFIWFISQPRGRKRASNNPPSTLTSFSNATQCTDQTEPPASQTIVNQGQLTHPTADQIAASMITQLRGAGLQLAASSGNIFSPEGLANLFCPMTALSSTISDSANNITVVPQPSVGVPSQNVQEHSQLFPSCSANPPTATVHNSYSQSSLTCALIPQVTTVPSFIAYTRPDIPSATTTQAIGGPANNSLVKSKASFGATASLESVTRQLLQASLSSQTRTSYNRMLKVYGQFCQEHFPAAPAIPPTHTMIAHFVSFLFLNNY